MTAGPLTLYYPKWIPGRAWADGANQRADRLAIHGERHRASRGNVILSRCSRSTSKFPPARRRWMPISTTSRPLPARTSPPGASTSPRLAVLSWNTVLLYPKGAASDSLSYSASLRIPAGWQYATALETRGRTGDDIEFETASLTTLVDSPVQLGMTLRKIDIPNKTGLRHTLNLLSESAEADPDARRFCGSVRQARR